MRRRRTSALSTSDDADAGLAGGRRAAAARAAAAVLISDCGSPRLSRAATSASDFSRMESEHGCRTHASPFPSTVTHTRSSISTTSKKGSDRQRAVRITAPVSDLSLLIGRVTALVKSFQIILRPDIRGPISGPSSCGAARPAAFSSAGVGGRPSAGAGHGLRHVSPADPRIAAELYHSSEQLPHRRQHRRHRAPQCWALPTSVTTGTWARSAPGGPRHPGPPTD